MKVSKEQAKLNAQVNEYSKLVKAEENTIDLLGHQPTLQKIRTAYHNQELSDIELTIVLTHLAQTLAGQSESFESVEDFVRVCFPESKRFEPEAPPKLCIIQQIPIIRNILADDKPKSSPKPRAPKIVEPIDKSKLPAHLQKLVK